MTSTNREPVPFEVYQPGVYLHGTKAKLAAGEGRGHIYVVEPSGDFEDDPNVTDRRFPGNPTRSFRTRHPLRVVDELVEWIGHAPEKLRAMRDGLDALRTRGEARIDD
jgi:rifampin ADP-ribosylating transferase